MKKIVILIVLFSGMLATSCNKLVELDPQNTITPEVALKDVPGYSALLISVYDRLQFFTYYGRDMALEGDALADNIYTVVSLAGSRYTAQNVNTRANHFNFWTNAYAAINELNTIIAGIDNIENVPSISNCSRRKLKQKP